MGKTIEIDNIILKAIAKEIEEDYDCEVIDISFAQLISLCVYYKVKFNSDFHYKPFEDMPKPETLCFSQKTASFYRRVDLFKCVKEQAINN